MPQGIQIFNSSGSPVVQDGLRNPMFVQKGTVTVASNTAATGTRGTVSLPAAEAPYLVFIRTTGNACVIYSTASSFEWFMAQGTTSLSWWAFNLGTPSGVSVHSVGLVAYDSSGNLVYDVGRPALRLRLIDLSGVVTAYDQGVGASNIITPTSGNVFSLASNEAVLYSDNGFFMDGYYPFTSQTVQADVRFLPTISTSSTALTHRWGRIYANQVVPDGISRQNIGNPRSPLLALCASIPAGI